MPWHFGVQPRLTRLEIISHKVVVDENFHSFDIITMTTWQNFMIITIFSCCLFILILTPIVSLTAPAFTISSESLENVSEYYGPGSVAAWILLALSNFEFLFYGRILLMYIIPGPSILTEYFTMKIDSTIIGTAAYSMVAFGDLLLKVIRHASEPINRRRAVVSFTNTNDPSHVVDDIQAQVSVMYLTSAISSAAFIPHFFYVATEHLAKTEVSPKRLTHFTRRRRLRLSFWAVMFTVSQLVMSTQNLQPSGYGQFQDNICSLATLIIVGLLFYMDLENSGRLWSFLASAGCFFLVFLKVFVKINLYKGVPFGLAWPQSSARISDLDQAAAVAVALIAIGASFLRWCLRRSGSDQAENMDEEQAEPSSSHVTASISAPRLSDEIDVTDAGGGRYTEKLSDGYDEFCRCRSDLSTQIATLSDVESSSPQSTSGRNIDSLP